MQKIDLAMKTSLDRMFTMLGIMLSSFLYVESFISQNSELETIVLYRWKNQCSESLRNLSKIIELVSKLYMS